jgi:multisubunit Na+/H+ antiporter MnhE subunit
MSREVQMRRVVFSTVALFLFWALLTSGFKAQESLMGAFAALLGSLVYLLLRRKIGFIFQPRMGELLEAWRLLWYLLTGSWMITQFLFLDLFGVQKAGSFLGEQSSS